MKLSSCSGCPLESHGQDFSEVEGLGRLGVMIIAEASGESEARDNLPLRPYAASGALYERTLRRLGLDRDLVATTNIVRCRPRENLLEGMWFESQAIAHCQPNLLAALRRFKPKVLVALGNVALKSLTGWQGEKQGVSHLRGYVLRAKPEFAEAAGSPDLCVIPTYHPAFLRRGAIHLSGVLARDILRATRIAKGQDKSFILDPPEPSHDWAYDSVTNPDPWDEGYEETAKRIEETKRAHLANWMQTHGLRYTLAPTPRDLDLFCRDVKARSDAWLALPPDARQASYLALSADIETRESASLDEDATDGFTDTIVEQIQFSIEPSQGIALSWDEDSQQAASWLLRLPLPKVGHNWWLFDQKVLRAVGARQGKPERFMAKGDVFDTLQMFHYWQPDLPAHLQAAATFACLASNTRIRLWNGKSEKINNIVTKKMNVELLGMDGFGNPIPVRIKNWFRADSPGQKWIKITIANTNQPIFCTPDHKIWTTHGWKLASELSLKDIVVTEKRGNNSLIHGTILGDGSVTKQGRLDISHCEEQLLYLLDKLQTLQACSVQRRRNTTKATNKHNYRAGSSIGTYWKRLFYPNGKKIFIPPPDDGALAIWYCDDGSIHKHKNGNFYSPVICVAGFSESCKDSIEQWFKTKFPSDGVSWSKWKGKRLSIRFKQEAAKIFLRRIAPYVPPSMNRKLPTHLHGQYTGWLNERPFQEHAVLSIEDWAPARKDGAKHVRYCVEVDHPTHRYFALGGLVSNSFPFPWKHLAGSNLPFYGCVDTDATLRVYLTARRTMEDRGIWVDPSADRDNAGYVSQVQRLRPILADMEDRGLPVDNLRRLALDKEFDAAAAEVFAELDARFPEDARRTTPREKGKLKGYADIPTDVKAILERLSATDLPVFSEHVVGMGKAGKEKTEVRDAQGEKVTKKFRDETLRRLLRARWDNLTNEEMTAIRSARFQEPPDKDDYEGELTRKVNAEGNTVFVDSTGEEIPSAVFYYDKRPVEDLGDKWARVYEFSPNSSQQLMRYMETKKHKVPVKKGGARTTEKKELERLAAKHHDNFYFKVIEFRELTKMRGTYIDGFRPHADGRVHTTFTFDTATGQLSSRNPNCFSADTDVLTMRGWVPFPDLEETDRVAEWKMDLLTNKARVRFSYPTAYMDQPFEGHLQHIYTDEQIDIMATGDHRCLLQHRKTQQIREFYASEYPEDYRQISAGVYGGGTISLRESQIALICALQADGHVHAARLDEQGRHRGEGGHYSIDLAKKRKIKRLRWALEKEGIPYNQKYRPAARDRKEQARHYISRNNIPEWWRDKKFFGDWILWLDRHSLDLLEREIWFWDGCASRDSMYSSSERINTNWAQIITILSNRRGKIRLYPGVGKRRDNWQVDAVNYSYSMTTNRHNEQVAYKGRVYCVSMPWGSIVVRRNGKVAFTGQCQNVPKHGRLADAFRAIIRHPTKLVVEWDYKSFHVLTTGFEAKDADYMRLARIDMHSFNAWHFMKLPGADKLFSLSDDELREKLEWFKSDKDRKYVRDKKAKAAGLGIGFGLGDEKLYLMNLESFESLAEAKKMKAMIKGLFPRVFRWQDEIRELAHRQTFLKSRYGSIRWFYEVKVPDGKGGMRSGEQSEEAIAFLPANSAFGHIRTVMRELDRNGMASRWEMVNTVHDSLIFLVPPDQLEEHVANIYPVMTAPSKVLIDPVLAPGGLSVDVEASAGVSWAKADLKEVKINLPSLPSLPQLVS